MKLSLILFIISLTIMFSLLEASSNDAFISSDKPKKIKKINAPQKQIYSQPPPLMGRPVPKSPPIPTFRSLPPQPILQVNNNRPSSTWRTARIKYRGNFLKLIYNSKVNINKIENLITIADKSSDSENPRNMMNYIGMIRKDDIMVINQKLLFWFSATQKNGSPDSRVVGSGGGLLAGVWEIKLDKSGKPSFTKINQNLYVQNLLLAGSTPGKKLIGADVYGSYPNSQVVWGIENAQDVIETKKSGKSILSIDKGPFSSDEGVFVSFEGTITNSMGKQESGFESPTDSDPRPGIIGKTKYILTYRIPAAREEIIQEVELKVLENNFGPISSAVLALNLPGYGSTKLEYASHPEMMPKNPELSLSNVMVNKYFKNTCVKKVFFYEVNHTNHNGSKFIAQTPAGRGRIACVGAPINNISFVCGYPNNDYIPKSTWEEYVLEITDNQNAKSVNKFNSLNYKLLSSSDKSITIKQGDSLLLIMRYKFLDASNAIINE